jgi:5-formyltetrahydrofolate cyclo-ligase
MISKSALRAELQARRNAIHDREERSARICLRAAALPLLRAAKVVHCYLPIHTEVDTRPLIGGLLEDGRRVVIPIVKRGVADMLHSYLPALESSALVSGLFATPTPRTLIAATLDEWDLILVPLLGFDRAGQRIGYGKGFYDRLLAQTTKPAYGLAFAAQEVPQIPVEAHDRPLNGIITEDEIIHVA